MQTRASLSAAVERPRARPVAALALLLAGSGAAALIYQLVWFELLGLVLGASALSLGVLLATFMGGLCLGSALLPRVVPRRVPAFTVLAALELGIAVIAVGVLGVVPAVANLYGAWAGSGFAGLALRAAVAALCLLPPTLLMGASLPAAARALATTPAGLHAMGLLYGANIAGAVAGSLAAGFWLLRYYDVLVATAVAAAINLAAAALAVRAGRVASRQALCGAPAGPGPVASPPAEGIAHVEASAAGIAEDMSVVQSPVGLAAAGARDDAAAGPVWPAYVVAALSGLTALAAEVVWTRHLSLLLGATVYAFAVILAAFLLGLALGSTLAARLLRRLRPATALAACQFGLAAAMLWAAYSIAVLIPGGAAPIGIAGPVAWLPLDLLRVAATVLPAALLWGASFPLALALAGAGAGHGRRARIRNAPGAAPDDPAALVSGVYVANTIGAIVGALATSFVLIVWLGSRQTEQLMIVIATLAGLVALAAHARPLGTGPRALAGAGVVLAAIAALTLPGLPSTVIAYGRFAALHGEGANVVFTGEGLTASIAVSEEDDGTLSYHSAGKVQASTYPQDLRLQRMLGHLTTLAAAEPEDFLVIGLGAGVTAGAVALDPAAGHVVVAELEPLVPTVAAGYFGAANFEVLDAPAVELRIDDGRHVLATTTERFDGITSDPLDPWVKGAATLYTTEFWRLARSRLEPGGVVTVFVQLYESTEAAVKSEIASFFEVFPAGGVFANTVDGRGYDLVLLARGDGSPIDVDAMHARLGSRQYASVARSLLEVGFASAADLLGTYVGGRDDLAAWLDGAAVNRDRNLRLQYLAGEGLNLYQADAIYLALSARRPVFPAQLFTGSPLRLEELRQRMRALPAAD